MKRKWRSLLFFRGGGIKGTYSTLSPASGSLIGEEGEWFYIRQIPVSNPRQLGRCTRVVDERRRSPDSVSITTYPQM